MNKIVNQQTIMIEFTWLYWTQLCAIYVLLQDSVPNAVSRVTYYEAFLNPSSVNKWDTKGKCVSVTHEQFQTANIYSIPEDAKAGDWFCVYAWEFPPSPFA